MIEICRYKISDVKAIIIKQSPVTKTYQIGIEDHLIFTAIELTREEREAYKIMNIISEEYTKTS